MSTQHLRIIAIISAVFWAALLLHIYALFADTLPDDETVRRFAEHYRVTSSLQLLVFVLPGTALSLLMWLRRSAWAAVALACLAAATFWWMYVAGVDVFFRPPLGDGSFGGALHGWWRLHSPAIGWHIAKISLLITSVVTWLVVYARLARERNEVA